jgi:hypothetical protein
MPLQTPRPAGWEPSRAGLDDFRGQRESEASLHPTTPRAQAQRRLYRQRLTERVYRLGVRAVFELVDEIGRHHPDIADDIDERLERYAGLDPNMLRAVGGDQFPASPVRIVGGTR